jgi:cephalosporin hydroxylase
MCLKYNNCALLERKREIPTDITRWDIATLRRRLRRLLRPLLRPLVIRSRTHLDQQFFTRLIKKTNNFGHQTWLGQPIWQNVFDLWTIQETLCELRPALLIECGTNRGGSSYFFATLFDLIGHGRVISIDIARMHELSHPRVTYLLGSSVAPEVLDQVARAVAETSGPTMVLLDSDHTEAHVRREMDAYHGFVTPGSFLMVQDGVIDSLHIFAAFRPGPLRAIETFLRCHPEFEVDTERCMRFLITHSPKGWLRRRHLPS